MSTGGDQKRPAGKGGGHPPKKPKPNLPQQGTVRPSQGSSSSTDPIEAEIDIAYATACIRFEELCENYNKACSKYYANIRKQRNIFSAILSKARANKAITLQQIADKQKTVEEQQKKLADIEEGTKSNLEQVTKKFKQTKKDNIKAYYSARHRAKWQTKQELVNLEDVRAVSLTPEGKAAIEECNGLLEKAKVKAKKELAALEKNLIEEIKKLIAEHEDLSKMMDQMGLKKTDTSHEDKEKVERTVGEMLTVEDVYAILEAREIDK